LIITALLIALAAIAWVAIDLRLTSCAQQVVTVSPSLVALAEDTPTLSADPLAILHGAGCAPPQLQKLATDSLNAIRRLTRVFIANQLLADPA
jgi:hypothetical protein